MIKVKLLFYWDPMDVMLLLRAVVKVGVEKANGFSFGGITSRRIYYIFLSQQIRRRLSVLERLQFIDKVLGIKDICI